MAAKVEPTPTNQFFICTRDAHSQRPPNERGTLNCFFHLICKEIPEKYRAEAGFEMTRVVIPVKNEEDGHSTAEKVNRIPCDESSRFSGIQSFASWDGKQVNVVFGKCLKTSER